MPIYTPTRLQSVTGALATRTQTTIQKKVRVRVYPRASAPPRDRGTAPRLSNLHTLDIGTMLDANAVPKHILVPPDLVVLSPHHLTTLGGNVVVPNGVNTAPIGHATHAQPVLLIPRVILPEVAAIPEARRPAPAPVHPQAGARSAGIILTTDAPTVATPTTDTHLTDIIPTKDERNSILPLPYLYHTRYSVPLNGVSLLILLICCVNI